MDPGTITDYFRADGAPDDGTDDTPLDSAVVSDWLRHSSPTALEELVRVRRPRPTRIGLRVAPDTPSAWRITRFEDTLTA